MEEVPLIPPALEARGVEPGRDGGVLAQQVEGDVPEQRDILGGVARADAALVLAKRGIQDPMRRVLDAPQCPRSAAAIRAGSAGRLVR